MPIRSFVSNVIDPTTIYVLVGAWLGLSVMGLGVLKYESEPDVDPIDRILD